MQPCQSLRCQLLGSQRREIRLASVELGQSPMLGQRRPCGHHRHRGVRLRYCTKRIPRPMSWSAGSACASKAPGDSDGRWDSRCIPHAWTSSLPGSPASSAPGVPAVLPRLRRSLRYRPSPRRHLPAAGGSARRSAAKGAMLGCLQPAHKLRHGTGYRPFPLRKLIATSSLI
jgi:hypothetical protein